MFLAVNTFENIGRFILVLIIFVFVLGITYFSTKFIADFSQQKIVNGNIRVHETFQIAQNKYLQIISAGKRYYLIAITKDNITLVSELNEEDIDLSKAGVNNSFSFKEILEKAKDSFNKNQISKDDSDEK